MQSEGHATKVNRLYERKADHLIAAVRRQVHSALDVTEDACSFAWMTLLRRSDVDPDDPRTFSWLVTVAVREGWQMAAREHGVSLDAETTAEPAGPTDVESQAIARDELALLDQLNENQRNALVAAAAGLSYDEIAAFYGKTYTWVNRHITEGRARLRQLRGG
jgi:RNA polymerase sigma factor (sigma-70 family)